MHMRNKDTKKPQPVSESYHQPPKHPPPPTSLTRQVRKVKMTQVVSRVMIPGSRLPRLQPTLRGKKKWSFNHRFRFGKYMRKRRTGTSAAGAPVVQFRPLSICLSVWGQQSETSPPLLAQPLLWCHTSYLAWCDSRPIAAAADRSSCLIINTGMTAIVLLRGSKTAGSNHRRAKGNRTHFSICVF